MFQTVAFFASCLSYISPFGIILDFNKNWIKELFVKFADASYSFKELDNMNEEEEVEKEDDEAKGKIFSFSSSLCFGVVRKATLYLFFYWYAKLFNLCSFQLLLLLWKAFSLRPSTVL